MAKQKTITIAVIRLPDPQSATGRMKALFRVQKATDSISLLPGESLTEDQVVSLCDDPTWKVTLVEAPQP